MSMDKIVTKQSCEKTLITKREKTPQTVNKQHLKYAPRSPSEESGTSTSSQKKHNFLLKAGQSKMSECSTRSVSVNTRRNLPQKISNAKENPEIAGSRILAKQRSIGPHPPNTNGYIQESNIYIYIYINRGIRIIREYGISE